LLPFFLAACGDASESPMVQTMTPTAVSVVVLETEPVALKRELPGRTRAFVIAEVRPLVTGIVKERLFTEGALVAAGDPLYQLVDSTYRAAVASAKAAVVRAEATLELARLDANRAEELRESNVLSGQEHDRIMATYNQAAADLKVAEARLQSAALPLSYARIRSPRTRSKR
jgi:membrane fusion protein (multidrug efflux system)